MQVCSFCSRHHRVEEPYCPFCGPSSWSTPAAPPSVALGLGLLLGLAAASCGDDIATNDASGTSSPSSADGSASMTSTTEGASTSTTSTTLPTDPSGHDDHGESYYAGPDDTTWGDGPWDDDTTTGTGTGTGTGTDTGTDTMTDTDMGSTTEASD